jgi:hypothetical protein
MTQRQIRVGIVGANAKKSWANVSHVPLCSRGQMQIPRFAAHGLYSNAGSRCALFSGCLDYEVERQHYRSHVETLQTHWRPCPATRR